MKALSILFSILLILLLSSCCDCDSPNIYSITDDESAILPTADEDSIYFIDNSEVALLAHSQLESERTSGRRKKCGLDFSCNCPEDGNDSRIYTVYFSNKEEFKVVLTKDKTGLATVFSMNGYELKQTNTLQNVSFGSNILKEILVFKWEQRSSRISVDGNTVQQPEIWYAAGVGVIKIAFSDGVQWEQRR